MRRRLLDGFCDAVVWGAAFSIASGAGLLLAAIAHH